MNRMIKLVAVVIPVFLFCIPAAAATWYVQSDGSGDAPNLQAAVDSCAAGDTVLAAEGTYTGVGNVNVDLSGKAIVMMSESGPYTTIIDCQGAARGVLLQNGEGSGTVFTGFTIANGSVIGQGGGLYVNGVADPEISNNIFVRNHATSHGGALFIRDGSPLVLNNTFVENSSDATAAGITFQGAASPLVSMNIIAFATLAAGVSCLAGANPIFSCNNIYGNAGGDALCGTDGGGNMSADPEFCGTLASGNFFLQSDSPCAPGNPCVNRIGALDVFCGSVSTEQRSWGGIKKLYTE